MGSEVDAVGGWGGSRLMNRSTPAVRRFHPFHRGKTEFEVARDHHIVPTWVAAPSP